MSTVDMHLIRIYNSGTLTQLFGKHMATIWEGGSPNDWQDEEPVSVDQLRRNMWAKGKWKTKFILIFKTSDGCIQICKDIYVRSYRSGSTLQVLEHITEEEYSMRKLAGTLETIPAECLENGFRNGYYK